MSDEPVIDGVVLDQKEPEKDGNIEPAVLNDDEQEASKRGWKPKEEWQGNADDWVTAARFNARGEMIGQIKTLERKLDDSQRDFNNRLDGQQKLHEAQKKVLIQDLESKRDEAIDDADREKANKIQESIDNVRAEPVEQPKPNTESHEVADWNVNNPWITEDSPKAAYAKTRYNHYGQSGLSETEALSRMEADIRREFPPTNPRTDDPPMTEGGRSKPGQRATVKLSWNQLTADELKWYNAGGGDSAWKKDDYLKAVADERKRVN